MQSDPTTTSDQHPDINLDLPIDTSQHGSPSFDLQTSVLHDQNHKQSGSAGCADSQPNIHTHRDVISDSDDICLAPATIREGRNGLSVNTVRKTSIELDGPHLDELPNEVLTHILSHLPAASLSAVSLVSHRLHSLVTTPHAWRIAFSRYFPGQDALDEGGIAQNIRRSFSQETREHLRAEHRYFTRLTAFASWRSEYILRTRLLRSLSRGKPAQIPLGHGASSRSNGSANNANAVVTYNSQLFSSINHIHGVFDDRKKSPRFIHGTDEIGVSCTSDPTIGKVDNWGLSDTQFPLQFAERFPGDQPYGLGDGLVVGAPNVMDVSQPFGMVYGEAYPGGKAYFRSSEEMRGRILPCSVDDEAIPDEIALTEGVSAVWIAKSNSVPTMTEGLVGIITGSTCGAVTTYSLGADSQRDTRLSKGEITAKWILSPGVPIIAISVDESYNTTRKDFGRMWAVALNALGEIFFLTEPLQRALVERTAKPDVTTLTRIAWKTGRNTSWHLAEPTRRVARDDPYHEFEFDGSYSPRSSSKDMNLDRDQLTAELHEIEKFLAFRPIHFRKTCKGWDMRRRLEVDFAGDDGNGAGESVIIISCGLEESESAHMERFTRVKFEQGSLDEYPVPKTPPMASETPIMSSLFGSSVATNPLKPKLSASARNPLSPIARLSSQSLIEEWRVSKLSLQGHDSVQITTSSLDHSLFAILWTAEDPLLRTASKSSNSNSHAAPVGQSLQLPSDIPGHRARFIAVGTKTGMVIIWDMRGPQSTNVAIMNELIPLRTIQTDSPQISCLALSALYLVHGGTDGLVQTWDPLASTLQPLRTLHSRFSSRARRRLVQAEASVQGVGINLYAAGAIIIDPDPTILRGMVSLGTHLRYWSYSSTAANHSFSKKRRLRRSGERGSNGGPDRFTSTGRGALMDYIATEQEELKADKLRKAREEARLHGRFGVGLAGLSDDEALQYAEMVSQETFQKDEQHRFNTARNSPDHEEGSSSRSVWMSETVTPEGSVAGLAVSPNLKTDDEFDHDIEEAIRRSLLDGLDYCERSPMALDRGNYDNPFVTKHNRTGRSASSSPSTSQVPKNRTRDLAGDKTRELAIDDLDFALQLSLAEEQSRLELGTPDSNFPPIDSAFIGKGKGKAV